MELLEDGGDVVTGAETRGVGLQQIPGCTEVYFRPLDDGP